MKSGPILARALLFRRFMDTIHSRFRSVKVWKTRHKVSVDIRIFFTVSAVNNKQTFAQTQLVRSNVDFLYISYTNPHICNKICIKSKATAKIYNIWPFQDSVNLVQQTGSSLGGRIPFRAWADPEST